MLFCGQFSTGKCDCMTGKGIDDILRINVSVRHNICDSKQNRRKAPNTPQG